MFSESDEETLNRDGESGRRRKFGLETDEFNTESLEFNTMSPADILGGIFSIGVEVRCGARDEHLGGSVAAVVKTICVDVIAEKNLHI